METVSFECDSKKSLYHLNISGDLKGKDGKVKVVAKNVGGEASTEADLIVSGSAPEFVESPIKCTVLEGEFAAVLEVFYDFLLQSRQQSYFNMLSTVWVLAMC